MTSSSSVPSEARIGVALYATAVVAGLAFGPRGPVYWDSFGYVAQAVTGQVGGLGLGRPLFVLTSHALASAVRAAGASVFSVEPILRMFWLAMAAFSAPLTFTLADACGLSSRAALFAGLAVALSPAMAHASAAVLTDGPSVAVTLLSLVLAARAMQRFADDVPGGASLSFAAGCVLGAAFGLREQAVVYTLSLVLIAATAPGWARPRAIGLMLAGLVLVAAVPLLFVLATQPDYLRYIPAYLASMARERTTHHYGLRDLGVYGIWLIVLGPGALVFGVSAWTRALRNRAWRITPLRAVCVPSILQLLLLAGYQDISYSPRYLVAALPGALAIPAGWALARVVKDSQARMMGALALLALPLLIGAPLIRWLEQPTRSAVDTTPALLAGLPAGSVVVTGQPCPAMDLYDRLLHAERGPNAPSWQHVCPGWEWPENLPARLDLALQENRVVVVDARDGAWLGREQRAARDEAEGYVTAHPEAAASHRILVWR